MVRWLSPRGLFSTGSAVVIAGIFGRYSDKREVEGAIPIEQAAYAFAEPERTLWIDYVADLGDGWDSTYTIARLLCQHSITLDAPQSDIATRRGDILVMGGDQVYPKADRLEYERRLVEPYVAATGGRPVDPSRALFAIPGNHDWYDGLTQFMRIFCREGAFAEWSTRQTRSYFALQLPYRWWLFGIDIAFDYYIDEAQLKYFMGLRCEDAATGVCPEPARCAKVHPNDDVILCTAKPGWEIAALSTDFVARGSPLGREALYEFERLVSDYLGCNLKLLLSGDLHHYVRYHSEDPAQPERITAGGGGAFLYPTHAAAPEIVWPSDAPDDAPRHHYRREKVFPPDRVTRWWILGALVAPIVANPSFAATAGFLYLALALLRPGGLQAERGSFANIPTPIDVWRLLQPPGARGLFVIATAIVGLALYLFADSRRRRTSGKRRRISSWLMALPHLAAHLYGLLMATFAAGWIATRWPSDRTNEYLTDLESSLSFIGTNAAGVVFIGGLLGGLVMGIYLLAWNLAGRHLGVTFAAMHISGYKNFVRIRLDKDGLTVLPIGIRKVCHRCDHDRAEGERHLRPVRRPKVELIEEMPISIPGSSSG